MAIETCTGCAGSSADPDIAWSCLPVPCFGRANHTDVKVATVSLNPSITEFMAGQSWRPADQRLAILDDFGVTQRSELTDNQIARAVIRREQYFRSNPHPFFGSLNSLLSLARPGCSYTDGTAVHLDVVACTTYSKWRDLSNEARAALILNCQPHFQDSLAELPNGTILLLNGRTVCKLLITQGAEVEVEVQHPVEAVIEPGHWTAYHGSFVLEGREYRYFGWSPFIQYADGSTALAIALWLRDATSCTSSWSWATPHKDSRSSNC